ncbi:MAG: hypothetical protein R3B70_01870 [Polyangiaceae bacterium]
MNVVHIELPASISEDLAVEIAKQAAHASRAVRALRWDPARRVAAVTIDDAARSSLAEDKVRRLITALVARHRPLPKRVLTTSVRRDRGPLVRDVEHRLAQIGAVRPTGPGTVALSGPALAFAQKLDALVAAAARDRFGARADAYPALLPADVLHRCGYLTSFPHAATMATHLTEDLDAIERFRADNRASRAFAPPDPAALAAPVAFLAPAVCYHLYPSLEGLSIDSPLLVVTAEGRCFRYESIHMRGLLRLWDFSMREIICAGPEPAVAAARDRLLDLALEIARDLDLDLRVETASDPFFSSEYAQKTYWQTRNDLKLELLLDIPPADDDRPRTAAASSFNLHEDHFGRTFGFTAGGSPAFTGCAAWGLSRWVLAAFAQHGLDPHRWPESWRSDVFS